MSHPGHAARLMLERKGVAHRVVNLPPGTHAPALRALGFPGETVPALKLDGRRLQGSLEISEQLESMIPEPSLYPGTRARIREIEVWGERVLQPMPRRLFRWGLRHRPDFRRWMAEAAGFPLPAITGKSFGPGSIYYALRTGATNEVVRADLAELGSRLDRVDALIADGLLGGEALNAADFQVGTSVRALMAFGDLDKHFEGRPAADHARRVLPKFAGPITPFLPPEWL